jgi:Zn-dependent protease
VSDLEAFLYLAPIILVSLVFHELAHAYVATRFGDPTPQEEGRLTLNPLVHLDPLGTAMFAITYFYSNFIFGWARPVLVNPAYFRNPQQQMAIVALAGPLVNFVLALVCAALFYHGGFDADVRRLLSEAYRVNVVLGIFNLIPIPPLDGSRIVGAFMSPGTYERWSALDAYGMFAIFGVIMFFRNEFRELMDAALARTEDVVELLVLA